MRIGYEIVVVYMKKSYFPGYHVDDLISRMVYFKDHKTDGRYTSKYLY